MRVLNPLRVAVCIKSVALPSANWGLISKIIENKGSVTNCIMVRPSAEIHPNRNETIVKAELEKSQKILKLKKLLKNKLLKTLRKKSCGKNSQIRLKS